MTESELLNKLNIYHWICRKCSGIYYTHYSAGMVSEFDEQNLIKSYPLCDKCYGS